MTTTFRAGDLVSAGFRWDAEQPRGRVIELRRQRDGAPFLMIETATGARVFPSAAWTLGAGPLEDTCRECDRLFRHRPEDDRLFCASCRAAMDGVDQRKGQDAAAAPRKGRFLVHQTRKHMRDAS